MALLADPDSDEKNFNITLRLASRHLLKMIFTILEGIVEIQTEAEQKLHLYGGKDVDKHARMID